MKSLLLTFILSLSGVFGLSQAYAEWLYDNNATMLDEDEDEDEEDYPGQGVPMPHMGEDYEGYEGYDGYDDDEGEEDPEDDDDDDWASGSGEVDFDDDQ